MKKTFQGILLDIFYPRRCPVCDKAVKPFGSLICETCIKEFEYIREPYCMRCGKELDEEETEYCRDCMSQRHLYNSGRAVFAYKCMSDSIYRLKYKGRQEYAAYYAECMAKRLGEWIIKRRPDALIPVPIHNAKKRSRGYNQAEALALELGKIMNIPVETKLIKRVRKTVPMKDLSVSDRQNNLKRAFKICQNDVKLNTIVVIDDIYTTGSTIDSMAKVLMEAGIGSVNFITLTIGRGI